MSAIDNGIIVYKALTNADQISTLQLKILLHTYLIFEPMFMHEIAKDLKVTTSAISIAVDKLEELGFLKRKKEKDDRRKVLVIINAKGNNYLERILNA